jgi:hypothetical protein
MAATIYPGANTTAQWFADNYPGIIMNVTDIVVLHTTEGSGWPSYGGGASAPTMTIMVDSANRRLVVRQHFPLNMSARALVRPSGSPPTNTAGVIQIELIGTCDPSQRERMFYWPAAPAWVLDELAEVIATLHKIRGIPLRAWGEWKAYPSSYGNTSARMSWTEWKNFSGVCGHQHVPANHHGDPGNINITYIMAKARAIATEGEDDMSAADVAAIKAHIDSKVDDIANLAADKVVGKVINRAWDGKPATIGGLLSSTHYYAVQAGTDNNVPTTSSTAPGTPTVARKLLVAADAISASVEATRAAVAALEGRGSVDLKPVLAKLDEVLAKLDALEA